MKLHQLVEAKSTLASLSGDDFAKDLIANFASAELEKIATNKIDGGFVTRVKGTLESGLQTKLEKFIMQTGFNDKSVADRYTNYFPPVGSESMIKCITLSAQRGDVIILIQSFDSAVKITQNGGEDGIVK
jgi:hypothetical protein